MQVRSRGGTLERPQCIDHQAFAAALAARVTAARAALLASDGRQEGKGGLVLAEGFQCFEDERTTSQVMMALE